MRISRLPPAGLAALAMTITALAAGGCDALPFLHGSEGERIYSRLCSECHGRDARGNTPRYMGNPYADLTDGLWKNASSDPVSLERVVRSGIFGSMPAHPELTAAEMRALVDHVRVLRGEKRPEPAR